MLGTQNPTYTDGRTKQSFKDETDINKILKRAQKSGTISHLNQYEARYGDFTGFDFFEAQLKISQGGEIFAALPTEIRNEFNQSPAKFFDFVNDPANKDDLARVLPALAEPGRQMPRVDGNVPADEARAAEAAEAAIVAPTPAEPETTAVTPPAAPEPPVQPPT